ncbi:hypothetical protein [Neobacillus terrae]|nr:hypothetical protein [Neobacillus terrae]NHM30932.1 hypothetical protein [Neobacillus terrae]
MWVRKALPQDVAILAFHHLTGALAPFVLRILKRRFINVIDVMKDEAAI